MSHCYSREVLALFVEDDLPPDQAEHVNKHLHACALCRDVCIELETSQAFIKSGLRSGVHAMPNHQQVLSQIRHTVLSKIDSQELELGWRLQIERLLFASFRKQRYAFASLAILLVISASLLAQMRHTVRINHLTAAVFEGTTLARPQGYRDWVFVGSSRDDESLHNIYVEPAAYKYYSRTGTFPEGTVLVREKVRYDKELITLEASVKDSGRFSGGWGFFDFTDQQGKTSSRARALPETSCLSCHEQNAQTDHVFTQYYPVLRFARMES
jgi:hypothetical protein